MVNDLIPLPVVVERLNHERNQDNPPETETEVREANIGADERQDAEEDKAKSVWKPVHRRDEASQVAMACHEVDRARHHKEYGTINREIMAQPFHDGNADSRKDGYPCNTQVKAVSHRLRIERPHQVAIA